MSVGLQRENRRLFVRLAIVAVGMFGFGYALVPVYRQICIALGINNLEQPATAVNTQIDASRKVTIEFDSNTRSLPWEIRPLVRSVDVNPGQVTTVDFEIVNVRNGPVTGQAVPSYGPQHAGQYLKKLECFCFTQQTLGPGEKRRMPVIFVVDPKLPKDVQTITLSYTFFHVPGREAMQ
jgi:cytochrome c oxidase assembly protein subunit 11